MKNKRVNAAYYPLAALLLSTTVSVSVSQAQIAQQQFTFNIPAKSVTESVNDIGRISGIAIVFSENQAFNITGNAVRGTMGVDQALMTLLDGTGLGWQFSNPHTVKIFLRTSGAGEQDAAAGTMVVTGNAGSSQQVQAGYVVSDSTSASKTNTSLMKTPQSVSVITRQQAEAQGAQSLVQALRYSSGVAAEVRGSSNRYDLPYIRGFGSPTDSNQYLDGLRLLRGGGYAIPQLETWGIERIEFLKGPSSTLYGGVTAGGMINAVSKAPTVERKNEVEALFGSHNRMQLGVDFSGPLTEERDVLYRVVALGRQSDSQVVNAKEERVYVAPSVTWIADPNTSVTFNASYQHDPEGGYYGVLPTVGSLWSSSAGQISRNFNEGDPDFDEFDRTQAMLGYQFEHRFNDTWLIRHNLRYQHLTTDTQTVGTSSLASDGHTISRYGLATDETLDGVTSDLQLQSEFSTGKFDHTVLLGYDYQHSAWSQVRDYGAAPSIDYLAPVYGVAGNLSLSRITNQKQHLSQSGFYLQDQLDLDRWTLVAGGRYDMVRMITDNYLAGSKQIQDDKALSGKLGLIYNFDTGIAPYISYSTSFLPVNGSDAAGNAFTPTKAAQKEVGVKYQPAGIDALFTLAWFDITQRDVVTYANAYTAYQTGKQRSRGVEFEGKVALNDSINMTGAMTWTRARVVEGLGQDVGDAPIGIPDYTASLWTDYALPDGLLHGVTLGAGVRYVGTSTGGYSPNVYSTSAQKLSVPGYTLFDAAISYDFSKKSSTLDGLTAKLSVTNLTDKTYVTCLANNFCNYGNGRIVYGSLSWRW